MKKLVLFTCIFMLVFSCAEDDTCRTNKQVSTLLNFYSAETAKKVQIDSISVHAIGLDSILYDNKKRVNSIKLPLNSQAEQTVFVVQFNEIHDTLDFRYTNKEYFVSYACGMVISHELDTVYFTKHAIEDLKIKYYQIDPNEAEHIQIFF